MRLNQVRRVRSTASSTGAAASLSARLHLRRSRGRRFGRPPARPSSAASGPSSSTTRPASSPPAACSSSFFRLKSRTITPMICVSCKDRQHLLLLVLSSNIARQFSQETASRIHVFDAGLFPGSAEGHVNVRIKCGQPYASLASGRCYGLDIQPGCGKVNDYQLRSIEALCVPSLPEARLSRRWRLVPLGRRFDPAFDQQVGHDRKDPLHAVTSLLP